MIERRGWPVTKKIVLEMLAAQMTKGFASMEKGFGALADDSPTSNATWPPKNRSSRFTSPIWRKKGLARAAPRPSAFYPHNAILC
jgi:hypothetical protein